MTADPVASLQRIVFPLAGDEDSGGLYFRVERGSVSSTRFAISLAAGTRVSFATYFATFPAGYWLAHTAVRRVALAFTVDAPAHIHVRSTDHLGQVAQITSIDAAAGSGEIDVDLSARASGCLWFEVAAGDVDVTLSDVAWTTAQVHALDETSATVCVTTRDRPQDCVRLLARLSEDQRVAERIDAVIVVDQGARRVEAHDGYADAAAGLGPSLHVIRQANLGGSGGFSRGMIAALDVGSSHALLLDDDVLLEPESILRMLRFAAFARRPVIVGAHMLSLTHPTVLHSFGERVDRDFFWWVPVESTLAQADLTTVAVDTAPSLSRTYEVDFNGWWMCLLPTSVIRRIGAALPLFIKWDDAEYGLRALSAGVPTVTLPGAALWHVPWTAKDDGLDWQAYYQLRNRLVAALLHSPHRRGGRMLLLTLGQDVNHLVCMQYGSAALRRLAILDVLAGPGQLPRTLAGRIQDARGLLVRAGQVVQQGDDVPPARRLGAMVAQPRSAVGKAIRFTAVVLRQARGAARRTDGVDVALPRAYGKWWQLGLVDSAVVESATGRGVFVARRDRRTMLSLLRSSVALHVRLWWRWPALAALFREQAPALSSPQRWEELWTRSEQVSA